MGRSPCCEKEHTNKGAWTKEEDERLINYIKVHGEGCWRSLPKAAVSSTATISTNKTNNRNNSSSSSSSSFNNNNRFQLDMKYSAVPLMQVPANIKIGADLAEDSNSSSGVTTEEIFPQLNLELSIGLPYQSQVSSTNLNDSHRQQQVSYQLSRPTTQAVCLCYGLGFQKSQACSCSAIATTVAADSLYRYSSTSTNS